jgi:hypothetical protein
VEASKRELFWWGVIGLTVSIPVGILVGVLVVDLVSNGIGWSW